MKSNDRVLSWRVRILRRLRHPLPCCIFLYLRQIRPFVVFVFLRGCTLLVRLVHSSLLGRAFRQALTPLLFLLRLLLLCRLALHDRRGSLYASLCRCSREHRCWPQAGIHRMAAIQIVRSSLR